MRLGLMKNVAARIDAGGWRPPGFGEEETRAVRRREVSGEGRGRQLGGGSQA